jgi:hypothetical protein
MTSLPYKVECKSSRPFYELIAAFDCQQAAEGYAGECALVNLAHSYEVKRGRKVLRHFGPEA